MTRSNRGALIARARELAELEALLANTEDGRGGLALIVGEPGIGKTALADVFADAAASRGATLAWGRAWEAGGAPAFWPWIEVLRELLGDAGDDAIPAVGASLAVVAEVMPELTARFPGLAVPPPLEPAQARFRLFDAVVTLLRWSGRARPVVVVLDDLHAADAASLSLLHFAARGVRRARVLLVGTCRDVEARLSRETSEQLARIAREGRYLVLQRLDRAEVASWVAAAATDEAAPGALADLLFERTEGNPLFLVETFRLLRTGRGGAAPALPEGVRDVIGARLRALRPESIALLEIGAVLGRTIDLGVVAAATGCATAAVRDRLGEALLAEVIAPAGDDRCAFTHILIREVVYGAIAAPRRAELHEAVARTLIERAAADPQAPLAEVVRHVFEAAPRMGTSEAIGWARRAAARAVDGLAFEDAVGFLERALGALPEGAATEDRCDLLLELAQARMGAGEGTRGREAARAAADLARRLGDPVRLARAALTCGEIFTFARTDRSLVELLEESLAGLPAGDGELRARLLGRLAAARQPADDPDGPMEIAREAIAMARRVATPAARLSVLQSATSALLYFAEPTERIELNRELVELGARHGDRVRALRGHLRLVFDYLERGELGRADASIAEYDTLAREIGHPAHLLYTPLLGAMRATMRGRFAEAEELEQRARALAERTQDPNRHLALVLHRLGRLLTSAQHDALAQQAPALLEVVTGSSDRWFAAGLCIAVATRLGRLAEARVTLESCFDGELTFARGRMAVGWIAEWAAAAGDAERAARAHALLRPLAARNHVPGLASFFCDGPLSRPLGMAAALLGQRDEAWRHFEDALARADALEAPPLRARVELDFAAALLRHGGLADRDRARRLLDDAQARSDQLGLTGIGDAAAAFLEEAGRGAVRPPAAAAPASRVELRREGEYWTVVWEGETLRLKDSRGLQILHTLIGQPDREFHVTDLLAPDGEVGLVEDSGEVLDGAAVASYRQRLEDLKDELAEAERWHDEGRAARLREELDFLAAELTRAVGLGGRRRRAGSTSEKARINVRRRIAHAIEKIAEHSPRLATHLEWTVKTGHFCAYQPTGRR